MSEISICCPVCSHRYDDEILELLDHDVLHDFRCEHCANRFVALIKECQMCNGESVFTWQATPPAEVVDNLSCEVCGKPFRQREEDDDDTNL